jgi:hypothetical protein
LPQQNEKNKVLDDSMQRALQKVLGQMPDVKPVSIGPTSGFTGFMTPKNALAVTNPFTGNISYSPEMMTGQSQDEMENTAAHELTHSRQAQQTPWYQKVLGMFSPGNDTPPAGLPSGSVLNNPYYWRPSELEAFQTERNRQMNQAYPVDPVYGTRDVNLVKGPSRMR